MCGPLPQPIASPYSGSLPPYIVGTKHRSRHLRELILRVTLPPGTPSRTAVLGLSSIASKTEMFDDEAVACKAHRRADGGHPAHLAIHRLGRHPQDIRLAKTIARYAFPMDVIASP